MEGTGLRSHSKAVAERETPLRPDPPPRAPCTRHLPQQTFSEFTTMHPTGELRGLPCQPLGTARDWYTDHVLSHCVHLCILACACDSVWCVPGAQGNLVSYTQAQWRNDWRLNPRLRPSPGAGGGRAGTDREEM